MIKKFYTLSLVATMLAGFSMVAMQQPSEARGQCGDQNFSNSGRFGNQFYNTASNRFNPNYGLSNAYGDQYFNNGNAFGARRNAQKQAMKQQRKLQQQIRRQQMAAAGIPFGNNAVLNANNPLLVNNGLCNNQQATAQAYNQGFQAGVNSAYNPNNGLYNTGYGVNGLNGLTGLNGLNGVTGYLNNGSGVSSILGRVLNGF